VSQQVQRDVTNEEETMKALQTIVATAVIVFALTTVAMAGVQHFTQQGGRAAADDHVQAAQPASTMMLVTTHPAHPAAGSVTAGGTHRTRQAHGHATAARHHVRRHGSGTHHSSSGSHGGHHHAGTSHGSGDCGDGGGDCGD
jgi:hypothetical protein